MIKTALAVVNKITYCDQSMTKFTVVLEDCEYNCINYNMLTGSVDEQDRVLINTTAVDLGLGTGGYHFVVGNISKGEQKNIGLGHIMKLRYTPMQINCLVAEAQESIYHEVFNNFKSLEGLPVVIGTLHSMLAPIALCLKRKMKKEKIVYIMSEGGALPIWMSDAVKMLVKDNIISGTITFGNSFGGDIECINIYSALIAAKDILKCDTAVVCMGPGIAGTDTIYGFSGIEQSYMIDAANRIGGKVIAVPRISFAEERNRHYGISHHSFTTLGKLCYSRSNIAIPHFGNEKDSLLKQQLAESGISKKHNVTYMEGSIVVELLNQESYYLKKMGRKFEQEMEYFITCALASMLAD